MGGTFSDVGDTDNLSKAFSVCLAGLLTVAVQDLTLTLTPIDQVALERVSAGNYPQSKDNGAGSVTVKFGDLYSGEVRKVLVDFLLPVDHDHKDHNVLNASYSYKYMFITT
jgi:hypothetical protein